MSQAAEPVVTQRKAVAARPRPKLGSMIARANAAKLTLDIFPMTTQTQKQMPQLLRLAASATPPVIPVLETDRLRLRALDIGDLEALTEMWAHPAHYRFIGNTPRTRSDLWQQILRTAGSWALLGYGYWAIEDRETGKFLGEAGFLEGQRAIEPSYTGTPEAGWSVVQSAWGKGIATEAMQAALAWGAFHFPGGGSVCIIEPDHAASIRVAEKLGYEFDYQARLGDAPINVYRRSAD